MYETVARTAQLLNWYMVRRKSDNATKPLVKHTKQHFLCLIAPGYGEQVLVAVLYAC